MKKIPVTLGGESFVLSTPTFYALQLMAEYGVDLTTGQVQLNVSAIPAMLAAILTDSEPLDDKGEPQRTWTPVQVAKKLDVASLDDILSVVTALLDDAFPSGEGDDDPPVKRRAGSGKP